jgi:hypothetical protein
MIIILFSALVCLVGLLMYALSANPKLTVIGLHMFWVGLLATLLQLPAHFVNVIH